jgi:pimeloyl-ACP methyl ester carboxylesterase
MRRKSHDVLNPNRSLAMPMVSVNGADLYHEVRGSGPSLLLIMGATGDGGHFDTLADLLADEFTVITYDRRGNGRSPAPAGWTTTSPEEQADDAAGLVDALGVGPTAVFGTSSGGNFALWMLTRHPAAVRGAVLHEPGVYALLDDFDAIRSPLQAVVRQSMDEGGPSLAVERSWQYIAGDDAWTELSPALRERLRASAGTLFGVELGTYERHMPNDEALAAIAVPVLLVVSEDSHDFFAEVAQRLSNRLGVDVATTPGRHGAYHDRPKELAETMRPFLREISRS